MSNFSYDFSEDRDPGFWTDKDFFARASEPEHVDPESLMDHLGGSLPKAEEEDLLSHLASCSFCVALMDRLEPFVDRELSAPSLGDRLAELAKQSFNPMPLGGIAGAEFLLNASPFPAFAAPMLAAKGTELPHDTAEESPSSIHRPEEPQHHGLESVHPEEAALALPDHPMDSPGTSDPELPHALHPETDFDAEDVHHALSDWHDGPHEF